MKIKIIFAIIFFLLFHATYYSQIRDLDYNKMLFELNNSNYNNFQVKIIVNKKNLHKKYKLTANFSMSELYLSENYITSDSTVTIEKKIHQNKKDSIWISIFPIIVFDAILALRSDSVNKYIQEDPFMEISLFYKKNIYKKEILNEASLSNKEKGLYLEMMVYIIQIKKYEIPFYQLFDKPIIIRSHN